MHALVPLALLLAGAIHLLPLAGVLGPERIAQLYGVDAAEANLQILLRHRAVLLAIVGALCVAAALRPAWRVPVLVAAVASVVSFLWVAAAVGGYNALLRRVVVADWVALALLALAAGAMWWGSEQPS